MNLRFRKQAISVSIIGKNRFWIGIIAGLVNAVCLSFFIDYSRESLRVFSLLSQDLFTLPKKEVVFFDYFFAGFSSVFGLGISLWIWLSNPRHSRRKERLYKHLAQTNIFVIIWIALMFIARWGTIIPIVLYSQRGYDNQLDLYNDGWLFFVMLPIVIFLNNWYTVRLVYKSGKWILFSFVTVIIITFLLAHLKTVDRDIFNVAFQNKNAYKYEYIDKELKKASKYGIKFSKETKKILKQNYTESTLKQVADVQNAFNQNKKISLDTLILEKIIIHHHKRKQLYYFHRDESDRNWSYAFPEQIYEQIKMCNDSTGLQYLFEIIHEMIRPLKSKEIDWSSDSIRLVDVMLNNEKQFYKYNTNTILSRLKQVIDNLKSDSSYIKFYDLIDLKYNKEYYNKHWQKEIIINFDSIDNKYNNNESGPNK